jgi:hypothetical protein
MMGDKADCSRCGCVLPYHSELMRHKSLVFRELMAAARKLFAPNGRPQPTPNFIPAQAGAKADA